MVATKPAQVKSGDAKKSGFTKEEELLLQNFSRTDTTKSTALFYGNALIVSAIPFCKYRTDREGIVSLQEREK